MHCFLFIPGFAFANAFWQPLQKSLLNTFSLKYSNTVLHTHTLNTTNFTMFDDLMAYLAQSSISNVYIIAHSVGALNILLAVHDGLNNLNSLNSSTKQLSLLKKIKGVVFINSFWQLKHTSAIKAMLLKLKQNALQDAHTKALLLNFYVYCGLSLQDANFFLQDYYQCFNFNQINSINPCLNKSLYEFQTTQITKHLSEQLQTMLNVQFSSQIIIPTHCIKQVIPIYLCDNQKDPITQKATSIANLVKNNALLNHLFYVKPHTLSLEDTSQTPHLLPLSCSQLLTQFIDTHCLVGSLANID